MDPNEHRRLETELVRGGLPGLHERLESGDGNDVSQVIADAINGWRGHPDRYGEFIGRHEFFRDLLAECEPAYRGEMYAAIAGRLAFAPKSLAEYESMIKARVSRLVSNRVMQVDGRAPHPIEVGGKKYAEVGASEATHAVVTVHCQRCWRKKRFVSDTPAGAMIAARKAGWQRIGKETCPRCVHKVVN